MDTETPYWPQHLFLDLDRNGPVPLYFQVSSRLEAAITSGEIPPGARLENEISISEKLGLSRPTIRRAIQEIVDKGMLVRRRGVGTQVVHGQITRQVALTSLYDDLEETQQHPSTVVLQHEIIEAPASVAERLGVPSGSPVLFLRRRRLTDGVAIAVLENYLPEEFSDISREQVEERGLYQVLRSRGVSIRIANQRIGARHATGDESTLLDIDRNGAVLTMERVAFDSAGRAVEYGQHCYRPDLYSFETAVVSK